jgi:hypothetical protein
MCIIQISAATRWESSSIHSTGANAFPRFGIELVIEEKIEWAMHVSSWNEHLRYHFWCQGIHKSSQQIKWSAKNWIKRIHKKYNTPTNNMKAQKNLLARLICCHHVRSRNSKRDLQHPKIYKLEGIITSQLNKIYGTSKIKLLGSMKSTTHSMENQKKRLIFLLWWTHNVRNAHVRISGNPTKSYKIIIY